MKTLKVFSILYKQIQIYMMLLLKLRYHQMVTVKTFLILKIQQMIFILKIFIINGYDLNSKNIELTFLATQLDLTTEIMMRDFIQKVIERSENEWTNKLPIFEGEQYCTFFSYSTAKS